MKLMILFFVLSVPLSAQSSLNDLPVQTLDPVVSTSDMTEKDFALMAGKVLHRFSSRTGFEACARICRSRKGQWGIIPSSIGAHSSCLVQSYCPKGMTPTPKTIHSHPNELSYQANEVDFKIWKMAFRPNTMVQSGDPRLFSEKDYKEPGYMVSMGTLYYQEGKGTDTIVGLLY